MLNISSGLGRRAMAGSALYCAAKAGMDHLSRSLALEEESVPNGARVVSLAPGVIDTDMQVQLRGADAAAFPERERFVQLQRCGLLDSPASIAFGVTVYSAVGPSYAAIGALAGVIGATVVGLLASTLGGTDRLISAPCAPAAAVLTAFAIELTGQGVAAGNIVLDKAC